MKESKKKQSLVPKVAFASYWSDGLEEEWLYFKLMSKDAVRSIVRAMMSMRMITHYRLDFHREIFRNGYEPNKWRLWILERDEALVALQDMKKIIVEMASVHGYELHWIPVNRLLNLKLKN